MGAGALQAVVALKHRNFRIFWTGQLISLIGTWMQNVAQGWLVLTLTNSPFLLGLVTAVQFTPMLLFSLFAGVAADRLPKRKLLLVTQSGAALTALTLGLLVLTELIKYWHVLVLAAILGTINAFDSPTRQSFIIELVGKRDLMNAIVLNSTAFNGARIVGPAVAGFAIDHLGMAPCFLVNAASYLAVIFGLLSLHVDDTSKDAGPEVMVLSKIKDGLNYIRQTPLILRVLSLMVVMSIFTMNFHVLVPVLARDTLGLQAKGYGYLMSAMGIGSIIGAICLAFVSHLGPRWYVIMGGAVGLCLFQLLLAFNRSLLLALILLGLTGMSMITFVTSVNTTLQLNSPDHLRGRVMSVYTLVFLGLAPLGSLFSGTVADVGGAPAGLAAGAVIGLFSVAAVLIWSKQKPLPSTKNHKKCQQENGTG
ncbi:MAG: MFS transporter [Thermacetogeniaceae bacterium]|nr:MFS transporter [Syntrophomonadaceae bacterium]